MAIKILKLSDIYMGCDLSNSRGCVCSSQQGEKDAAARVCARIIKGSAPMTLPSHIAPAPTNNHIIKEPAGY
jgi:hypothetical protein